MRFSTAIISGLFAAVAYAQETSAAATTSVSTATTVSPASSTLVACLEACSDDDVDCRAECVGVPNPSETMITNVNDCVLACPKGNGTEPDNLAYEACLTSCIDTYYTSAGTGGAAATGTTTGTAGDSTSTGSSDSDSTSGDDSSDSDSDSDSNGEGSSSGDDTNAAGVVGFSAVLGLVAIVMAL